MKTIPVLLYRKFSLSLPGASVKRFPFLNSVSMLIGTNTPERVMQSFSQKVADSDKCAALPWVENPGRIWVRGRSRGVLTSGEIKLKFGNLI